MSTVVAGLGFRRDCPAEDIVQIVRSAQERSNRRIDLLAVPTFKADEPGFAHAATLLALPMMRIVRESLRGAQGRCLTRSDIAEKATGLASVAEACALAAAGDDGRLILARIANARATCALAERP